MKHAPIVYTSADSVLQVACHEDEFAPALLHKMCEQAREIMCGKDAVSRIIARPFIGEYPNYTRTENRKDFSVNPPKNHLFEIILIVTFIFYLFIFYFLRSFFRVSFFIFEYFFFTTFFLKIKNVKQLFCQSKFLIICSLKYFVVTNLSYENYIFT